MSKRSIQSVLALSVLSLMMAAAHAEQAQQNVVETNSDTSQITRLDTIVITASGYEQDLSKAPASMTVISSEELGKR